MKKIANSFVNPFLEPGMNRFNRFFACTLWGVCLVVCQPLIPFALLGWGLNELASALEKEPADE